MFTYNWGRKGKSDFLYTEAGPIALNEVLMCTNTAYNKYGQGWCKSVSLWHQTETFAMRFCKKLFFIRILKTDFSLERLRTPGLFSDEHIRFPTITRGHTVKANCMKRMTEVGHTRHSTCNSS
jgi:hypothetical protein